MLKRKLTENNSKSDAVPKASKSKNDDVMKSNSQAVLSDFFAPPLWKAFYDFECELNVALAQMKLPTPIKYAYNPIEYAAELHCAYLRKYVDGKKKLVFVGMNPGPNGMGQTGVPFGNVTTVRDVMDIKGNVGKPPQEHPKRLVNGLLCTIEEPSGVRIWNLLQRLAGGSLNTFSRQCFVHNFCPLAFFDANGKNITPSELRGEYKAELRDVCLNTLLKLLNLLQPEIIVAVGEYVFTTLKNYKLAKVLKMPHPSPRSLNNTNWPEKAELWLQENDLLKYIRNEVEH